MRGLVMMGLLVGLASGGAACAQAPIEVSGAQAAAQAGKSQAVATAQAALLDALRQTPMSLPVALFVTDRAEGYGMYTPRDNVHFKAGEPMHVYIEPLAYKYKSEGGLATFGLTMDFAVLAKDGNILGGKESFLDTTFRSHRQNTELMLNATISLQNAPAGDYQLELVVHDKSSTDVARTRLPFTID